MLGYIFCKVVPAPQAFMPGVIMEEANNGNTARPGMDSPDTVEISVFVQDELGLHARPAARVSQLAQDFEADVTIVHGSMRADAKSILDVLSLAAPRGATLTVLCSGRDAGEAAAALGNLFSQSLLDGGSA
jgi:phosphocarrier protein